MSTNLDIRLKDLNGKTKYPKCRETEASIADVLKVTVQR
jgi:hypothetical protein